MSVNMAALDRGTPVVGKLAPRFMGLAGRFVLCCCAVALVTAVVVGGANYLGVVNITKQRDLEKLKAESQLIAEQFRSAINQLKSDATAVSHMPPFQGLIRSLSNDGVDYLDGSTTFAWRHRLQTIFHSMMIQRPDYVQMRFVGLHDNGRELVRTDKREGKLVNTDSQNLQEKSDEPYFRDIVMGNHDGFLFSPLSLNRDYGRIDAELPVLRMSVPVYEDASDLYGMMVINVHAREFIRRVMQSFTSTADIYVVTDTGDWMLRNRYGVVSPLRLRGATRDNAPEIVKRIFAYDSSLPVQEEAIGDETYFVQMATVPFMASDGSRFLRIVAVVPEAEALADAHATRIDLLWVTFVVAVAVALLSLIVARAVSKPIIEVVRSISKYEVGDGVLALPSDRRDEIGDFARAFKGLVEKLEQAINGEKHSRIRLKTIMNNTADGIITIDRQGKIESFNTAAENMFQFKAMDIIGKNVNLLMPESYRAQHDLDLQNFSSSRQSEVIDTVRVFEGMRQDGSRFPMELSASTVDLGSEVIFSGIVRDISERQRLEKRLSEQMEELQRSNEDLDEFAYIASHDLKEPLRAIYNHVLFLEEDHGEDIGQDGRDRMARMQKICQRAEQLTSDLLHFSRIGRSDLAIETVDLNKIVESLRQDLSVTLEEKNASILINTPLPEVVCDRARIASVLQNLIANAIKYNDAIEKTVEIGFLVRASRGDETIRDVFFVRDNGIGIDEEARDMVFKMFKRLNAEKTYGAGTGAGLAFVKKIIERHDGEIWLDSTPGTGTTFYFHLGNEAVRKL